MRTGALETQLSMDDAMARDGEWVGAALAWITLRRAGATFTADTLTEAIGRPHGRGDAIGAVFSNARRRGEIRAIGFQPSTRPERHGNPIRIWERK